MTTSEETHYLALLRGINVGGNNLIKMTELKLSFENMGFKDVVTYIQSGNVIFKSTEKDKDTLTFMVEKELSNTFEYKSTIVLCSYDQLESVVHTAPDNYGTNPDEYRYDVLFLKEPLTSEEALKEIKIREGVDNVYIGNGVLYFSRLISRAGQSYLNKVISLPVYKKMTIRNWNTTTKLLLLMEKQHA